VVPYTTVAFELMGRFWPMEQLENSKRLVAHAISVAVIPDRSTTTGRNRNAIITAAPIAC